MSEGTSQRTYNEASDPLDLLEAKTRALEMKLFGVERAPEKFQSACGAGDIADALIKSQTIMSSAISSHEKIGKFVKRMDDLDAVLDPTLENVTMRDAAKIETLLLMYDRLHNASVQLKQLKDTSDVLNSDQIRSVLKSEDRLNALVKSTYDNKKNVEISTADVVHLLTDYNRLMNSFTKMFAQLDQVVTDLEIASEYKPVLD